MAMLFGFLVISVGLGALIRHMQKITTHAIQTSDRGALLVASPPQPQYIEAKSAIMTSVTENTTRSFEVPGKAAEPE